MTAATLTSSVLKSLELSRSVKENHGSKILKIATSLFDSQFSNLVAVLSATQVTSSLNFVIISFYSSFLRLTFMILTTWDKVTWTLFRITRLRKVKKNLWIVVGWPMKTTDIWQFYWNQVTLNC